MSDFKEQMRLLKEEQRLKVETISKEIRDRNLTISDYTDTYKTYKSQLMNPYYDYAKEGIEFEWFMRQPVHFRFVPNGEIYTLQLNHFITNLLLWSGIVRIEPEVLGPDHIIDANNISTGMIKSYIDAKIVPYRDHLDGRKLNAVTHDIIYNLGKVSNDFNEILAISISIETFIDLANRYPRFDEILHLKVPDNLQPKEVEQMLSTITKEQMAIIRDDDQYNHLKPILQSSNAIKEGQFKEFAVNYGLKPSLKGETIPITHDSNILVGGINKVSMIFIDSLSGRKSLILNKTAMGNSGHFARLIMLVTSDVVLRKDEIVCKTKHPILMEIKSDEHLQKLKSRYYRYGHERQYKILTGDETYLIGETIYLRSPITCASKEGICRQCYGDLFYINRTLNSAGGLSATRVSEPVTQNILSAKHLLATDSELIKFTQDVFHKVFTVYGNEIMINDQMDDLEGWTMLIIRENIVKLEEYDKQSGIDKFIPLFHIRNPEGDIFELMDEGSKELFFTASFNKEFSGFNKGRKRVDSELGGEVVEIPLVDIPKDSGIFVVEVQNNELTKPLYGIMDLLDNKKKRALIGIKNHEQAAQRLLDLLIESDIAADSIHGEMILRSLIRSISDILELPDFSKYNAIKDTQIMTIKSALNNHPSITVSLSFQYLSKQLESPLTFRKRDTSYLDAFFKNEVDLEEISRKTSGIIEIED